MYSLLSGYWQLWFNKKEVSLAVVGLDGSGKTVTHTFHRPFHLQTLVERISSIYSLVEMPARISPTIGLNGFALFPSICCLKCT